MSTASQVIQAFLVGTPKKSANTINDGSSLYLFGNKIAEHRPDGLFISNCGWFSKTTKERLNQLPGVSIRQSKGKWYLNDAEWDGNWIQINTNQPPTIDTTKLKRIFIDTKVWKSTDGWRGYEEPKYAIVGANDTGGWDDSPCPTDLATEELSKAKEQLKGIPTKELVCTTSNVFCAHRYLIVPPYYVEQAREIIKNYLSSTSTELLYAV